MAKIGSIQAEQDHRLFLAGRRLGEALRERDLEVALLKDRLAKRAEDIDTLLAIIQKQAELLDASAPREER